MKWLRSKTIWSIVLLTATNAVPVIKQAVPSPYDQLLDVALAAIGLTALIGIAYSFKFVWSPLIDRLPRRSVMIAGSLLRASALLAVPVAALLGVPPGATDGSPDSVRALLRR